MFNHTYHFHPKWSLLSNPLESKKLWLHLQSFIASVVSMQWMIITFELWFRARAIHWQTDSRTIRQASTLNACQLDAQSIAVPARWIVGNEPRSQILLMASLATYITLCVMPFHKSGIASSWFTSAFLVGAATKSYSSPYSSAHHLHHCHHHRITILIQWWLHISNSVTQICIAAYLWQWTSLQK